MRKHFVAVKFYNPSVLYPLRFPLVNPVFRAAALTATANDSAGNYIGALTTDACAGIGCRPLF